MIGGRRRNKVKGVAGVLRADHRTQNLLHRLGTSDIALLDHQDLDQGSAEALVDRRVAAVLDAADSLTGAFPNAGPLVLHKAGIPLVDQLGAEAFTVLNEGDKVVVRPNGVIEREGVEVLSGRVVDQGVLDDALRRANRNISSMLEDFMRSTVDHLERERELLMRGEGIPELHTSIEGRHVVVVAKGRAWRADLEKIRRYLREHKPVVIAVDEVVDSLLESKIAPDVIVGDMDVVSSQSLSSGAELVVHSYPDGRAPGLERVRALGLDARLVASIGTSADIAMLIANERGAELIVTVGTHDTLAELLDKGRSGNPSTFIVRLKVGPKLVDADTVGRLYRSTVRTRDVAMLVGASVTALVAAAMVLPGPRLFVRETVDIVMDLFRSVVS